MSAFLLFFLGDDVDQVLAHLPVYCPFASHQTQKATVKLLYHMAPGDSLGILAIGVGGDQRPDA